MNYEDYKSFKIEEMKICIDSMRCQPILFIGSGLSRRYFDAPSWMGLLEHLANSCHLIDKNISYYHQKHNNDPIAVAEEFAAIYREWAWGSGRNEFPDSYFDRNTNPQSYLKFKVAEFLNKITLTSLDCFNGTYLQDEIASFKLICPHAVITTNYDRFIEISFPEYRSVVGQKVLLADHSSIGDIFKIDGCTTKPESIIITKQDYNEFEIKQKYLSAKLFAYFAEHPIFFIGYSASDPNIRSILTDINEIVSPHGELIHNIFIVTWDESADSKKDLPMEELIPVGDGKHVRVKKVVTSDFKWVYEALAHRAPLQNVNVKLMRSLLSRVKQLVRSDIPSGLISVNYQTIEGIVEKEGEIENIFGISRIDDPRQVNLNYPNNIKYLAEKLGYNHWNPVKKLIQQINEEKKKHIECNDNVYHIKVKTGKRDKSYTRKYSEAALLLLKKVRDGLPYEVDIPG